MLAYHPAFDSYHCFLRILTILSNLEKQAFEIDRVRILDYYLCVPTALVSFKFPREIVKDRQVFRGMVNHFNEVPNKRGLFLDIKNIQDAVFDQFLSMELIEVDAYRAGKILLQDENMPPSVISVVKEAVSIDSNVKDFVLGKLSKIPLLGINGLKHRSGLMDHRYDLV